MSHLAMTAPGPKMMNLTLATTVSTATKMTAMVNTAPTPTNNTITNSHNTLVTKCKTADNKTSGMTVEIKSHSLNGTTVQSANKERTAARVLKDECPKHACDIIT